MALIKKNSEVPSCNRIADNFNITLKQQMLAKKPGHLQKLYKTFLPLLFSVLSRGDTSHYGSWFYKITCERVSESTLFNHDVPRAAWWVVG